MIATYLEFHALFVTPPILALLFVARVRFDSRRPLEWAGVGLIVLIALVYTTPWDNYLIAVGVWEYGPDTVTATIGLAPVEEYVFIVLQPIVAGIWLYSFEPPTVEVSISRRDRVIGALAGGIVGVVGAALLLSETTFYMGAILAWAGPVLGLQWGFGWPYLWRVRRRFALAVSVPTAYFASVDRIAIDARIWIISSEYTTGMTVAGLPVEEGAFFLITNVFVVQGLLLYSWILRR
jgi:lycopene cyclase domain-containing protein